MELYVLLKSILFPFSNWKWVRLVLVVEGSSKHSDFFIKFRWPLIRVIIKKSSYQTYNYFNSHPPSYPYKHGLFTCITPLLSLFYFFDTINLNPTPPPHHPPHPLQSVTILPSPLILSLPSLKFSIVICYRCCYSK